MVSLVLLDFSTAFDTVDHDVLLDVLSTRFGISGSAHYWFNSYLRPKSCLVEIEDSRSSGRSLEFLVPQGRCRGPVLYSIYASSLQTEIPASVRLNALADDHLLNCTFKVNNRGQEAATMNCLEQCVLNVSRWMNQNRLKMNSEKIEFILFGSQQHIHKYSTKCINVCGDLVKCSDIIRIVGHGLTRV